MLVVALALVVLAVVVVAQTLQVAVTRQPLLVLVVPVKPSIGLTAHLA
jgi:hypothetical protein